ncbi:GxxExxY protein [Roseimicrobium gellanilyticum]|uniref:GxxExxY protein n=1 Tax=Roseimicrobium gellanilyticum TaxID=748857 RepID=A0A366H887_9BACT|nr:GxxExxY protein [Roseimicrobium gellanilyticum]RBP37712.1 GxxExxY protein [Roseimicrobium gellanilyticum]
MTQMIADNVELTQVVIGAAMKVLNTLRPGLDEKLYERALVIELGKQGVKCDQQKSHDVYYDGKLIGTLIPDLIVENRLIVDPKVVTAFNDSHIAQMLGYLNITGLKTALLLNFKHAKLGIRRVSNSRPTADDTESTDEF